MRRRIVIALLAVVVIGVVAFFLSQPKKGSVEWHKRQYLAAWKEFHRDTWTARLKAICYDIAGKPEQKRTFSVSESERMRSIIDSNWTALVNLGYISEKIFVLTNCSAEAVYQFASPREIYPVYEPFVQAWSITRDTEQEIVLRAPTQVIARWQEIVRKVDAPRIP